MALKSTVIKADVQISNMDINYYAQHSLTLAQHPSETDERLMLRVLAFMLHASDSLEFGKGLSNEEEPDLWRKAYTDEIELLIELGQPDESRIRKACAKAKQVVVINYGGRAADIWWDKVANSLQRFRNLTVLDIPEDTVQQLTGLLQRGMRLQALIQDGELQLMDGETSVAIRPVVRMSAT